MAFNPQEVITFWFEESSSEDWFAGGEAFDETIRARFRALPEELAQSSDSAWQASPEAALAAVLVLDQFTRNMYRGDAKSFAYDAKALEITRYAIAHGWDRELPKERRHFLYMPFMHSEDLSVHQEGRPYFESLDNPNVLEYEDRHVAVIKKFGRYPHRNAVLGRASTEEEEAFLSEHPDGF